MATPSPPVRFAVGWTVLVTTPSIRKLILRVVGIFRPEFDGRPEPFVLYPLALIKYLQMNSLTFVGTQLL